MTLLGQRVRHAPLLRRASRLWDLLRPAYEAWTRLLYGRRGIVLRASGVSIRLDPACRWYSLDGDELWPRFVEEIRVGDRVADVGANIGVYSIVAAKRGAKVTSFEPNPQVVRLLERNLGLNCVTAVVCREAVGDHEGSARFHLEGPVGQLSQLSPYGELTVPMIRLSGGFDVVKIDVEGAELDVLRGAAPAWAEPSLRPRALFLEIHRRAETEECLGLLPANRDAELVGTPGNGEHWVIRF
jgi:FkbM family methyltransferase